MNMLMQSKPRSGRGGLTYTSIMAAAVPRFQVALQKIWQNGREFQPCSLLLELN